MGHAFLFRLSSPFRSKQLRVLAQMYTVHVIVVSSAGFPFRKGKLLFETIRALPWNFRHWTSIVKASSREMNVGYSRGLAKHVPGLTSKSVYPGETKFQWKRVLRINFGLERPRGLRVVCFMNRLELEEWEI
jgi:hypothetical protein